MRRACRFSTRPPGERWRGLRRGSSRWCPSERERNETNVRRALAAPQGCSTSPASRRPAATSACSCRAAARSQSRREERESERASERASEDRARESERGSSERKGARVERERASEDRARDDDTIKKRETPPRERWIERRGRGASGRGGASPFATPRESPFLFCHPLARWRWRGGAFCRSPDRGAVVAVARRASRTPLSRSRSRLRASSRASCRRPRRAGGSSWSRTARTAAGWRRCARYHGIVRRRPKYDCYPELSNTPPINKTTTLHISTEGARSTGRQTYDGDPSLQTTVPHLCK